MHSFTMHYEQFFLPADCLIGEEQGRNRGFYLQMRGFANGRLQTGGRALGLSQAALEKTVAYAKTRRQFGRPIGEYQLTQYKLGRMKTKPSVTTRSRPSTSSTPICWARKACSK